MRLKRRGCRLVLRALIALALAVAPFSLSVDGLVVTKAYAGKGGGGGSGGGKGGGNSNGGGNSGGGNNGNGSGGNSGSAGGSNSGSAGGSNSGNGGNSGNGNSGGDNGNGNSGGNSGNNGNGNGDNGKSSSASAASTADVDSHVNALTGDKVEASRTKIQVTHRNGMKEKIENGRFRMEDKYGRTIVDRKATVADLDRLKSL
ncbi:hypothetical protein RFM41_26920 [Mesorhizobium sp. VK25A]|uniref:hypothetical protein n=1 Tax=Mesorhizobium vachelliae TaxID=3072309 RepID=UPI002A243089|nr:hypothetical protein [Mesorhizobium sp. VK25A]MDX8547410.1 hypothetical protein [Mesorhizobium sp. VK25A]